MRITCDWHIHSHHSPECVGNPDASLARLFAEVEAGGITDYGLTDHLHTAFNIPALAAARREFDRLPASPGRHFGVEVSCLREYDHARNDAARDAGSHYGVWPGGPEDPFRLAVTEELIGQLGISYVIGGAHWPLGVPDPLDPEAVIRCYHRQNLFLAAHPLVDIVAHPWWWMGAWQEADGRYLTYPWLDDFGRIPDSMHEEFAATAIQHGKALEINAYAILLCPAYPATFREQYREYLAFLKERGVRFSVGSDSHEAGYQAPLSAIEQDLDALGLGMDDLWQPRAPETSRIQANTQPASPTRRPGKETALPPG